MNLVQRLLNLKEQIKRDEKNLIEAQTELKIALEQLKKEFGISSIEDAKQKLKEMNKREAILNSQIEKAISDIEERYET